ncbi:hypothetical protein CR513_19994, partial [Mucuna pruriens]
MKRMFLQKFFLASKTTSIKKEICGIRQPSGEILYEYWERFNKLCGLILMDESMIDTASGNTQQFDVRGPTTSRGENEVTIADNQRLENRITGLTSLSLIGQHYISPPTRVCDICASAEHPTDACPTL